MAEKSKPEQKTPATDLEKRPLAERLQKMHEKVWSLDAINDRSLLGRLATLYRVIFITVKGCLQNKIPMQSAALTYYSLMSIAPIVGLALIVSGFILKREGSHGQNELKAAIVKVIYEVVPQAGIVETAGNENPDTTGTGDAQAHPESLRSVSKTLDEGIDRLLNNAASGKAGVAGIVILSALVVMMISRVENAFNSIWSVERGRSWKNRFVNYFLFSVLTFLLGAASLTMLSASSIARALDPVQLERWLGIDITGIWGGETFLAFFKSSGPTLFSIAFLTVLIACLNKYMPSTRVLWRAAFAGGLLAALIIIGNQKLAAIYVSNAVSLQNLYGELSIVLIIMLGMYLTWLFLLIGGQFSYAVQNVRFLADHRSWESLSIRVRQTVCFAVMLIVSRRFKEEKPAPTASELGHMLRVPANIIGEALKNLIEAKFVSRIVDDTSRQLFVRYQPAKPLNQITVASFKDTLETQVGFLNIDLMMDCDPALPHYPVTFRQFAALPEARATVEELLRKDGK